MAILESRSKIAIYFNIVLYYSPFFTTIYPNTSKKIK